MESLQSGFVTWQDSRAERPRFAALWTDKDKAELYDKPLGSRRNGREGEATARLGYETANYLRCDGKAWRGLYGEPVAYLEPVPLSSLRFEGEPIFGQGGEPCDWLALGFVPLRPDLRGHCFCGGEVVADLYLASRDRQGLPWVRHCYISRETYGANAGKLCVAIPG